jgi:non-specific serine/threonine protein kinase
VDEYFLCGHGHGLLQLGAGEVKTQLPTHFLYWREFGARYVTAVCTLPDTGDSRAVADVPPLPAEEVEALALSAPPMTRAEYLTSSVLQALWDTIDAAFRLELSESNLPVQDFLKQRNSAWNLVGRVHFNLAENRNDDEAPFVPRNICNATIGAGKRNTCRLAVPSVSTVCE